MTNNILDEVSAEGYDEAQTPFGSTGKTMKSFTKYPKVKVWNPDPSKPGAERTPGLVVSTPTMTGRTAEGKEIYTWDKIIVPTVKAVLLYATPARRLATGQGAQHRTVCQSHDGHVPSLRIDKPLCQRATSEDVAAILSQWKGFDKAKLEERIQEVTLGSNKLSFCGLKKSNGDTIPLCPLARKDSITGQQGACRPHIYIKAYDLGNNREFEMELTGSSIRNDARYISPFHEFFKYIRSAGKPVDGRPTGLPYYIFEVDLTAQPNNQYFVLGVSGAKILESSDLRADMKARALTAEEDYQRSASFMSKEAFKKVAAARDPKPTSTGGDTGFESLPNVASQNVNVEVEPEVSWEAEESPF